MGVPVIVTGPRLRLATEADAEAVRRIYAPYVEDTAITFELTPPSADDLRDRIQKKLVDFPWLVCEVGDNIVGYAYAGPVQKREAYQWSVESSVYVDETAHGQGIGSELYESLFALLELQGYIRVYALVTLPNPASVSIHESFGFEQEAEFEKMGHKNGAWHDVGWWSLALRDHPDDPYPPLSLSAAKDLDGWDEALGAGQSSIDDHR